MPLPTRGHRPAGVRETQRQRRPVDVLGALALATLLAFGGCAARTPTDVTPATLAVVAVTQAPADASARVAGDVQAGSADDGNDSILADARRGEAHAQLLMAERYLAGNGVPRDLQLAHEWLAKSVAQDHAPALDVLAALYYRGVGVAADFGKARELMERAVEHRYLPAINNLAWLLATCPDDSVRDGKRAVELLAPAMDQSAQMLDTYAAALAETGDFENAGEYQRRAVMALNGVEDPRFGSFIERLTWYGSGKPWRDPPQDAPRDPQRAR